MVTFVEITPDPLWSDDRLSTFLETVGDDSHVLSDMDRYRPLPRYKWVFVPDDVDATEKPT
jgi:hypothetical protein